jgi:two-component system LytT family response regulator
MPNTSPSPSQVPLARAPLRTAVIIDDEQRGRTFLSTVLSKHFPEIKEVGQAKSVDESIALIDSTKPDIVFLDIEIIGGTGFEVLNRIAAGPYFVVFISAYANYREEADRYAHSRFLLKPISIGMLREALE